MKKIQLFLLQFLLISITQHTNAQLPVKTEYTVEMGGTSGKGTYAPMWLTANRQGLSSANTENGYLRARDCTYNAIKPTFRLQCRTGFGNRLQFHLLLHHPTSLCRPQLPMVEPEYRQQRTLARVKEFQVKQRRYGRIK